MQQSGQRPRRETMWRTLVAAMRQSSGSRPAKLVRGSSATNIDLVGERHLMTLQIPEYQTDQPSMKLARAVVRSAALLI
jgi:hypothetical protein